MPSVAPVDARQEFPVMRGGTYLDVAARAPMADRVAAELSQYIAVCQEGPPKQAWLSRVEEIRERVGKFVGASADEIAFTKNTSDGLNTIAHGLGLQSGDNVVIVPEIEHGNNIYMWLHLREQGVELRTAEATNGALDLGSVARQIDHRTRIVSISSVSFITGARADLAELSRLAHAHGAFLLVDAVQGLGVVRMDMDALGIDGLAAATQKGLLGMYGLGILYCRSAWLTKIRPPFLSRIGVDLGAAHESDVGDIEQYRLRETAGRFEVGNPNFAGLFALDAALSLLEDVGMEVVEGHVLALSGELIAELGRLGLRVLTPADPDHHAGIVTFEHPEAEAAVKRLQDHRVRVSLRRGLIRVSFHIYNDRGDVETLLGALAEAS